jgi:hypothetical protein
MPSRPLADLSLDPTSEEHHNWAASVDREHLREDPGTGGNVSSSPQMGKVTWRALRVQLAGVKSGHSPLRQIGDWSTDRGSVSDSQADSACSIPPSALQTWWVQPSPRMGHRTVPLALLALLA